MGMLVGMYSSIPTPLSLSLKNHPKEAKNMYLEEPITLRNKQLVHDDPFGSWK